MASRSDIRDELLNHPDPGVSSVARKTMLTAGVRSLLDIKAPDLSEEMIRTYATHPRLEFRMTVASRSDLDVSILKMLIFDKEKQVSAAALRSPSLSEEVRNSLGGPEYRRVWPTVLKYLRPLPGPVLAGMLLVDPSMAEQPNMPDSVVLQVLEDAEVSSNLTAQILAKRPILTDRMWAWLVRRSEREIVCAGLGRSDLPPAIRRVLVSRLPDELLLHVARDSAAPPWVLDEMCGRKDTQLRLVAARHPHINDAALARLVWDEDPLVNEAVTARLLKNAEPHLKLARREWIKRLRSGVDNQS